ncbi:MAG TPA: hypothetical protein ENN05_12990 [Deltaproteobacteria bacterium]|nr:hypothetical protein [Deltaproteobacteria bacterium]
MMDSYRQLGPRVSETLGGQFRILIRNLIRGNQRNARSFAHRAKKEMADHGNAVTAQNIIEDMAQSQAMQNALINSPSIVPGIGTFLSFWLIGLEDFFLLDRSVKLVLALCGLEGIPVEEKNQALEDFIIKIIGQTYKIADYGTDPNTRTISNDIMTILLPRKYAGMVMNIGLHRIVRRILPFKRRSRLLPVGLGIGMSAYNAYDRIVAVGRLTLKNLSRLKQDVGMSDDAQ